MWMNYYPKVNNMVHILKSYCTILKQQVYQIVYYTAYFLLYRLFYKWNHFYGYRVIYNQVWGRCVQKTI